MSGSVIVGFSAAGAGPGAGVGAPKGAGAAAGAPANGFAGLLNALLSIVGGAPAAEGATADPAQATELVARLLAPEAAGEASQPRSPGVTQQTLQEEPVPGLPAAAAPLLADLVEVLAAVDAALQGGQPLEPALREKLDAALAALATELDLPPEQLPDATALLVSPVPGVTAPVPAAPAIPPPAAAADAAPTAATPAPPAVPATAAGPSAPVPPPAAPSAAAPSAAAPTSTAHAAPAAAPAEDASEAPQSPLLPKLAEKLQAMARAMEPAAPELAARLQLVADKLAAGALAPQQLAALGLDADGSAGPELAKAVELLLAPAPQLRPAAAPPPFAAASLTLPPQAVGARPNVPPAALPSKDPPAAAPEPRSNEPPPQSRAPERRHEFEPAPQARSNAAPTPAAAEPALTEARTATPTAIPTTAVTAAAGTKAVHVAYQAPPQQLNLPQVAFEMVRQFQAGNSRFQIRLDPPELGRIDVRMDMDRDGNVLARMTVERSETLDLMQRDQRALEKALAQAGLDSARTNLEFSLRQQGAGRDQRDGGQPGFGQGNGGGQHGEGEEQPPQPAITYHRGSASPGGLNLFV